MRASGGGILHWRGADHRVVQPEVIDAAIATPALNAVLRRFVRILGIKTFLRVRRNRQGTSGTPGAGDD